MQIAVGFTISAHAVLSGGETRITPSPLTKRNGTVRLVVWKQNLIDAIIYSNTENQWLINTSSSQRYPTLKQPPFEYVRREYDQLQSMGKKCTHSIKMMPIPCWQRTYMCLTIQLWLKGSICHATIKPPNFKRIIFWNYGWTQRTVCNIISRNFMLYTDETTIKSWKHYGQ